MLFKAQERREPLHSLSEVSGLPVYKRMNSSILYVYIYWYPSHASRMDDTIIHIGANNLMLHSCILRIVQILRPNYALLLSLLCLSIRLTMQILLFLLVFSNIQGVFCDSLTLIVQTGNNLLIKLN